jgi:hypothetical protein
MVYIPKGAFHILSSPDKSSQKSSDSLLKKTKNAASSIYHKIWGNSSNNPIKAEEAKVLSSLAEVRFPNHIYTQEKLFKKYPLNPIIDPACLESIKHRYENKGYIASSLKINNKPSSEVYKDFQVPEILQINPHQIIYSKEITDFYENNSWTNLDENGNEVLQRIHPNINFIEEKCKLKTFISSLRSTLNNYYDLDNIFENFDPKQIPQLPLNILSDKKTNPEKISFLRNQIEIIIKEYLAHSQEASLNENNIITIIKHVLVNHGYSPLLGNNRNDIVLDYLRKTATNYYLTEKICAPFLFSAFQENKLQKEIIHWASQQLQDFAFANPDDIASYKTRLQNFSKVSSQKFISYFNEKIQSYQIDFKKQKDAATSYLSSSLKERLLYYFDLEKLDQIFIPHNEATFILKQNETKKTHSELIQLIHEEFKKNITKDSYSLEDLFNIIISITNKFSIVLTDPCQSNVEAFRSSIINHYLKNILAGQISDELVEEYFNKGFTDFDLSQILFEKYNNLKNTFFINVNQNVLYALDQNQEALIKNTKNLPKIPINPDDPEAKEHILKIETLKSLYLVPKNLNDPEALSTFKRQLLPCIESLLREKGYQCKNIINPLADFKNKNPNLSESIETALEKNCQEIEKQILISLQSNPDHFNANNFTQSLSTILSNLQISEIYENLQEICEDENQQSLLGEINETLNQYATYCYYQKNIPICLGMTNDIAEFFQHENDFLDLAYLLQKNIIHQGLLHNTEMNFLSNEQLEKTKKVTNLPSAATDLNLEKQTLSLMIGVALRTIGILSQKEIRFRDNPEENSAIQLDVCRQIINKYKKLNPHEQTDEKFHQIFLKSVNAELIKNGRKTIEEGYFFWFYDRALFAWLTEKNGAILSVIDEVYNLIYKKYFGLNADGTINENAHQNTLANISHLITSLLSNTKTSLEKYDHTLQDYSKAKEGNNKSLVNFSIDNLIDTKSANNIFSQFSDILLDNPYFSVSIPKMLSDYWDHKIKDFDKHIKSARIQNEPWQQIAKLEFQKYAWILLTSFLFFFASLLTLALSPIILPTFWLIRYLKKREFKKLFLDSIVPTITMRIPEILNKQETFIPLLNKIFSYLLVIVTDNLSNFQEYPSALPLPIFQRDANKEFIHEKIKISFNDTITGILKELWRFLDLNLKTSSSQSTEDQIRAVQEAFKKCDNLPYFDGHHSAWIETLLKGNNNSISDIMKKLATMGFQSCIHPVDSSKDGLQLFNLLVNYLKGSDQTQYLNDDVIQEIMPSVLETKLPALIEKIFNKLLQKPTFDSNLSLIFQAMKDFLTPQSNGAADHALQESHHNASIALELFIENLVRKVLPEYYVKANDGSIDEQIAARAFQTKNFQNAIIDRITRSYTLAQNPIIYLLLGLDTSIKTVLDVVGQDLGKKTTSEKIYDFIFRVF